MLDNGCDSKTPLAIFANIDARDIWIEKLDDVIFPLILGKRLSQQFRKQWMLIVARIETAAGCNELLKRDDIR